MRQFYVFFSFLFISFSLSLFSQSFTIIAEDDATNYTDWNGNPSFNEGTAFEAWIFLNNNGGKYIGGTAIGDPSFGLFSDGSGNFFSADRPFTTPLQPGDKFSADIGHTGTINGEVGVQFLDGDTIIWTLKFVGGLSFWKINDGGSDFDISQGYSPNSSLTLEFTYEGSNQYSYTFGNSSGNNFTFSGSVSNIDKVRFFNSNQGGGQNFGFNNLKIEGDAFKTTNSGSFSNSANWENGDIPNGTGRIIINNSVTINSDINHSGDFIINSPNVLSISPGHSLKFTGSTFTNNGGVIMGSTSTTYSSFIPSTSSTITGSGQFEYLRHTNSNTDGNDLISPPLSGDSFGAFATRNNADLFFNPGNSSEKLFGPFDTSATTPAYVEYTVGPDDAESLIAGKGYRGASVSGTPLAFQGSVLKDDVSTSIINNGETDFKSWNLVGNPFSSYVNLPLVLENSTTLNSLDPLFQAFYFYNANTGGSSYPDSTTQGVWTIVTALDFPPVGSAATNTAIAPGQGFFVKAKSGGGTSVVFEQSNRLTATESASSDDGIFGRMANPTNIARAKIGLASANTNSEIDIYFLDDATLGLDPGYDVGGFGGSSFGIFTNLLNGDTGVQMAIQSLPYSSLNSVSIPLGINMDAGTQFTLELNDVYSLLPDGIDLYLDDTLENTSTLLNSGDYVLTPVTSLSGTGRFYLRFSNNALTATEQRLDHVTVYTNQSTKTINISGQLDEGTIAMVYDVQGRKIITQKLSSESILQRINSDDLSTGVYIVKLYTKTKSKSVKLIIR